MKKNSFLKGAMWGTLAVFLSKLLGFIYLIPFNSVLEVNQQIIFTSSYRIYAYVLLIATAGIPFATANLIARYNAHKNYAVSFKLLRSNTVLMLIIGSISAAVLMIVSNTLANFIITDGSSPQLISNVSLGIKISAIALIFVPIISVIRGFFQGYKEIKISSISQLVEQFINSFFILAALLLAGGSIISNLTAVYFSILCATLGSVASLIYLYKSYKKLTPLFKEYYNEGKQANTNKNIPLKKIYLELFALSIPYIAVILLAQSNDLIDLMFTIRGLVANGFSTSAAQEFSTIYGMSVIKLMTIPLTISTGLSVALVPHLAEAHAQKNYAKIQEFISKILTGTISVLIPIVFIMMAASRETFVSIGAGRYAEYGSYIFQFFGIYTIINTIAIIVDNMMLSLNQRKRALLFISAATIFKLACTYLLIATLGIFGLALSSIISCLISTIPSLVFFKYTFKVNYRDFFIKLFYSLGAGAITFVVVYMISHSLHTTSYIANFSQAVLVYLLGFIIYFIIALKLNIIPDYIIKNVVRRIKR